MFQVEHHAGFGTNANFARACTCGNFEDSPNVPADWDGVVKINQEEPVKKDQLELFGQSCLSLEQ
jgi:hypothetical protein